jgi:hypothetical protein
VLAGALAQVLLRAYGMYGTGLARSAPAPMRGFEGNWSPDLAGIGEDLFEGDY